MDVIPFLITITFGDLTGSLDDVTKAFASVDAKADYILAKNPEVLTGHMAFLMRKGAAAARALDEAQIKHARRELLLIPVSDEAGLARVRQALGDAGIAVDLEFHLKSEPQAYALGVNQLNEAREICRKLGVLEGLPAAPTTGLSTPVMPDGTHVMPDTPQPEPTTAEGFVRRGVMRGSRGDPVGAIADFDRALQLDPESAEAFGNRGDARLKLGDLTGALADYGQAIRFNPKDVIGYTNRATVRAKLGDPAGAIEDLNEAIRLNPQFAIGYFNRGHTKQDQGDLAGAIEDYNEAIRLNPKFVEAYVNRGNVRAQLGDRAGAEADLQIYRELSGKK